MVPGGGLSVQTPSPPVLKRMEPDVRPVKLASTDSVVDFPAPLEPRSTKMPYFGIVSVRSATAVTRPSFERNNEVLNVLLRFSMEIATSDGRRVVGSLGL